MTIKWNLVKDKQIIKSRILDELMTVTNVKLGDMDLLHLGKSVILTAM